MAQVTGRRYRPNRTHPEGCDTGRCNADLHQLGEHRSRTQTLIGGGKTGARLSATRVWRGDRHFLELHIVAPLDRPTEAGRAHVAQLVLDGLVYTITRALGGRP